MQKKTIQGFIHFNERIPPELSKRFKGVFISMLCKLSITDLIFSFSDQLFPIYYWQDDKRYLLTK
ncbi:hypothetical protein [Bacillus sp. OAE603]|uniref:hypothetical protein n=1 Tax=Gottfriedia sp. OAE603 TaxID=2663872 RepID=UPI00178A0E2D